VGHSAQQRLPAAGVDPQVLPVLRDR
jgi:hypothetical protein